MDDDRLFEFDNRYYDWCTIQSENEIRAHCPNLKAFSTGWSQSFVVAFRSLPLERAILFGKYLVRRRVLSWLQAKVPNDNKLSLRRQARMRRLWEARKAEWEAEEDDEFERIWEGVRLREQRRLPRDSKNKPARRKVLRAQILKRFPPEFGRLEPEPFRTGEPCAALAIGDFRVLTFFDTGGKFKLFEYSHEIYFGEQSILCSPISLMSYLGLSGGTMWTGEGIEHEDSIIQCTLDACRKFLEFAPVLLAGL